MMTSVLARPAPTPLPLNQSSILNIPAIAGIGATIVLGLSVLMAIHLPASAQDLDSPANTITVHWHQSDLVDPAHIQRLLTRIDRAALQVCGAMDGASWPVINAVENSDCHKVAFEKAVTSMHLPTTVQLAMHTPSSLSTKE